MLNGKIVLVGIYINRLDHNLSKEFLNVFNEPAPTTVLGSVFQFFTTLHKKG